MSTVNPYEPPKAEVADIADPVTNNLASRGQRLGAALLDALISMVWVVPIWLSFFKRVMNARQGAANIPPLLTLTLAALSLAMYLLVNGYFLKSTGQTLGKKIVGIRIAALDDSIPSLGRIVALRIALLWIVSLIPVVGGLVALIDALFIFRRDRRCLHDLLAGTKVVRV